MPYSREPPGGMRAPAAQRSGETRPVACPWAAILRVHRESCMREGGLDAASGGAVLSHGSLDDHTQARAMRPLQLVQR